MEKYYYPDKLIADHVALLVCRNGHSIDIVQIGSEWCMSTDAPRQTVICAATIASKRNH